MHLSCPLFLRLVPLRLRAFSTPYSRPMLVPRHLAALSTARPAAPRFCRRLTSRTLQTQRSASRTFLSSRHTNSKSKAHTHRRTRAMRRLVTPPLLRLVSRPFRARSVPYFVASMPHLSSIRRTLDIANRTGETLSVSLPLSSRPMTVLRPASRLFRLRFRCCVAQVTVAIIPTDRATPRPTLTAESATMTRSQLSRLRPDLRLVARPPYVRSLFRVEKTMMSIAATRRAIARANRTTEKRVTSPTAPRYLEPRPCQVLPPPPPSTRSLHIANVRSTSESSPLHS